MTPQLAKIIVLAMVQGVAEFLPISSSGHLVILAAMMDVTDDIADVNIVLHAGTLLSILVYYFRRVLLLLTADRRVIPLLIVGTIPAVIIGLTIKQAFEELLENALLAGLMLVVTGFILLATRWFPSGTQAYRDMGYLQALKIGTAQAVAILPGISRSGATISAGLGQGLSRNSAATFSFLLAIPAIGGASVLELKDVLGAQTTTPIAYLAMGAGVSFIVGLASLWWLVRWLERGRLYLFAFWCIPVGVGVVIWQWMAMSRPT